MLLGYFDESYFNKDFWYAAVIVTPSQLTRLSDSFSQILENEGGQHKELHGSEIFAATGPWATYSVDQRKELYERCLRAISEVAPTIVARGVHMTHQNAREKVAFRYLVEEIDKVAQASDDRALLLGDESHERLQRELRQELRDISRWSTGGYKPRQITRILDAPFWPIRFKRRTPGRRPHSVLSKPILPRPQTTNEPFRSSGPRIMGCHF